MEENPWLAIDTGTVPLVRARELRQAWEDFLGEGEVESVRAPIAASWRRCDAAGVDPSATGGAQLLVDAEEALARWRSHPLWSAAPLIRSCLAPIADGDGNLIVVSDADGILLWVDGPDSVRYDAAEAMNFTEGAAWGESEVGTNAVGTALAADHAVQVFAAEHFNEIVQRWTCAAAPVHDPETDRLVGIIDLTGWMVTAHPHSLACATATAQAVEEHLRCRMQERDGHLRRRYEEHVVATPRQALATPSGRLIAGGGTWIGRGRLAIPPGGGELILPNGTEAFAEPLGHEEAFLVRPLVADRRAGHRPLLDIHALGRAHPEVSIDGRPLQLSPRHVEILVLLCINPRGMSAEELATELYGELGHPGTVRVQVSRLRKLLGGGVETDPYRIGMDVRLDFALVGGLLDRGLTREAAERYRGPLMAHSQAPGIVRERGALEHWLRQAVMTSDSDGALWAWLESDSGHDDLLAWQRLLGLLPYGDPRRSLAATRVTSLRAALL